uniref:Calcium/calmodulin-dependent 3',5'-cyclic nucleotide phosphodiesterase 1A n=1 Tax=Sphaerodactylus townsendi TaxID=933632 RepID=A0ACB8GEH1_9SAUR
MEGIPLTTLISFADVLEGGYSKYNAPYHNAIHAADVTQTVHSILLQTGAMHWFTDLEILAIFFSTSIHDYGHTGTTNSFHIQTRSEVALLYNDMSVLENYHVSAVYQLLQKPELNILVNLTQEEWR